MNNGNHIKKHLLTEAFSLLSRLKMMQPFALSMPMVPAASVSPKALSQITSMLNDGHIKLSKRIYEFIHQLKNNTTAFNPIKEQKKFVFLKLRFNDILSQLDIYADVLSQRAEHITGTWIAGLDALAEDALKAGKQFYDAPEMIVFLERGHGAAIRRAKTRLPGGEENPVAVIQVPRERMVGSGIASSLIHEVGHQGSALLDLITSLKNELNKIRDTEPAYSDVWTLYARWISEIISDFWSLAHLGICATQGLMGVVSLPEYFQFRIDNKDPHPAPYIRVLLSCAMGNALFPHPQWKQMSDMWEAFYPLNKLPQEKVLLIRKLKSRMNRFAAIIKNHKPASLKGKMLHEIFPIAQRQPALLQKIYSKWQSDPQLIRTAAPSLIFAVIGQARADGRITAKAENEILTKQLIRTAYWKAHNSCNGKLKHNQQLFIN